MKATPAIVSQTISRKRDARPRPKRPPNRPGTWGYHSPMIGARPSPVRTCLVLAIALAAFAASACDKPREPITVEEGSRHHPEPDGRRVARREDRRQSPFRRRRSAARGRRTGERAAEPLHHRVRPGVRPRTAERVQGGCDGEGSEWEARDPHLGRRSTKVGGRMALKSEFETPCPCCQATLVIDTNLRRVVRHIEPVRGDRPELSDAQRILAEEAARREALFQQSVAAENGRAATRCRSGSKKRCARRRASRSRSPLAISIWTRRSREASTDGADAGSRAEAPRAARRARLTASREFALCEIAPRPSDRSRAGSASIGRGGDSRPACGCRGAACGPRSARAADRSARPTTRCRGAASRAAPVRPSTRSAATAASRSSRASADPPPRSR